MFLPEVAYYATNNPNHVFFLFVLSFLKVCFHTILNMSKNIVFHVNLPRCLVRAFDSVQASISSYFNALLPIRRLSFLSHMQVPLFWITVFVNILQLSFSIYFFLIWTWLFDRQTLVSVYIQRNPALRPPRLYDHLLPQLTSHSLSTQTWKSPSHFIILKTPLMRPPRYYDQDFMAQRWSHQRGSSVFFNFSFPHRRTKKKMWVSWTMEIKVKN